MDPLNFRFLFGTHLRVRSRGFLTGEVSRRARRSPERTGQGVEKATEATRLAADDSCQHTAQGAGRRGVDDADRSVQTAPPMFNDREEHHPDQQQQQQQQKSGLSHRSTQVVSASSASIRAILLQLTSIYIRTPAKLFRPARFDYLTVSRMLLANELAGKPYHIFTHSSPALLYESVRRLGWRFIPNQVLPPIIANCAIGVVLYSTYLTFLQYFTSNRGWKWTIAGVATGEGSQNWYSWMLSFYDSFRAGFIAGAVSSVAASPIDALYSRSNYAELVDGDVKNDGLYKYAWKKLKAIGIVGIFAGFWLNLIKESLGFGFYFSVFEVIKSQGYSRTKSVIDWFDRIRGLEADPNDVNTRKSARALQLTFVLFAGASAASALIAVQYPFNKVQKIHLARLEALDIFNEANKIETSKWFRLYYNSYKQTLDILIARRVKSGMTWPAFMYRGFTRFTLTNIPATSIGLLVFEITRQKLTIDLQDSLKEKLEA